VPGNVGREMSDAASGADDAAPPIVSELLNAADQVGCGIVLLNMIVQVGEPTGA